MRRVSGPGLFWLDPRGEDDFPEPETALSDPNGLLAVGGNLSPGRILGAYRRGIFPWYSEGQPILWWSPDPRTVLFPERLRVSRSLRKTLRKGAYRISADRAFQSVLEGCAAPRPGQDGTWLLPEMQATYRRLHKLGYAHSVEAWCEDTLVGGLYGLALGGVFYGESMFTRRTDASKVAFVHLVRQLEAWGFGLIDCQMRTSHLISLGAEEVPRRRFLDLLARYCEVPGRPPGRWELEPVTVGT
jgi:leucyl/phenylalanyl-tRNA--protein transferase